MMKHWQGWTRFGQALAAKRRRRMRGSDRVQRRKGMTMEKRPNILWYCTDQQRFDTIGALGNPHIHTPRLDAFVRQSVAFTHAYCQSPICTPSRASFMTGMYPSAVSVTGNGNPVFPQYYEDRLISRALAFDGHDCGLVGKLHLASAFDARERRVNDGYRYFQYSHDHRKPNAFGHEYADWLRAQGVAPEELMTPRATLKTSRTSAGRVREPTADMDNIPPHLHQTYWCTEKSIEFIEKNRRENQPWLLNVNPFDPHPPFDAPWEYYRRYDPETLPRVHFQESDIAYQSKLTEAGIDFQSQSKPPSDWDDKRMQASYYAMIEQIDHEFGRLLDYLDAKGLRENTIVIFTSDHGEALGDHGLVYKGCRFYEGLVRVPLIISWPTHFLADVQSDALVELLDLVPTLYEVIGADIP
ncbi:MAG: sulfatase-like hydrolase/transferase [Candidatus Poribacteria bacterium]|nr:sulfatase-like hydrolase/transferase [Candidatus Poribacteria bacterium]